MKNLVKDATMGPLREALKRGIDITNLTKDDMRLVTLQVHSKKKVKFLRCYHFLGYNFNRCYVKLCVYNRHVAKIDLFGHDAGLQRRIARSKAFGFSE